MSSMSQTTARGGCVVSKRQSTTRRSVTYLE